MNRFKAVLVAFCMILVVSAAAPVTKAQNGDMKTVIKFSEPIEIPGGTILPAGTYFFKLLNSDSGRWVVQIFDENQTKTFATLITVQDFRYQPTNEVVMTFAERPAGSPPAIKEWFFVGEQFGREFVYPKPRAIELAKQSNEPVLAMPVELAPDITAPVVTGTEEPVVALERAPIVAVTPSGKEVPTADVTNLPLPHTASSIPQLALAGLLAIGVAFVLATIAKRIA